ncbi:hypothetical protein [Flavobacterium sp.]|uniref:hypothetical protein n=1 Tax=Flavobacterium sp. TaxID=239 RepID=UPI002BFCAD70|nr:hypothetical protein [Flavobacterium sp.]HSD07353.1 hypothetical protein [Flavobacterium sp.]
MIKKLLFMSLVLSQLTISCSSSDDNDQNDDQTATDQSLAEQIATITKQPYSNLTPDQQKVKLESEANEMLVQLDKTKKLSAIDAIENLNRLLDISTVDIFNGKNDNNVEDIINVSGVYGIYTWDNSGKKWIKTTSSTELKFVFPAKESLTTNNASFSANSVSSTVKVPVEDSYNWQTNVETNDYFFLPTSTDATLTIDGTKAATFAQTAKYSNGNEVPNEFGYKMTLIEGYTWEMSGTKGTEPTAKASFTYNGKSLINFNSRSTANIDELLKEDALAKYRGTANGLITLMDNFVIVADMDLATQASDEVALEKSNPEPIYPDYNDAKANYKAFYTALNAYYKKQSEGDVANYNKNMKLILVSKKDGTKIADVVARSEKDSYSYTFNLPVWDSSYGGYWNWGQGESFTQVYYNEVYYLRFNDKTEVEMSAYFSTGFTNFETKFEDFITAFEK